MYIENCRAVNIGIVNKLLSLWSVGHSRSLKRYINSKLSLIYTIVLSLSFYQVRLDWLPLPCIA